MIVLRNAHSLFVMWLRCLAALAALSIPFARAAIERGNGWMLVAMVLGAAFYFAVLLAPDDLA